MKIVTVLGARPQFIKAGSVSREIARQCNLGNSIDEIIVHTGQHYDTKMSDVFFEEMKIPKPNYFLGLGGKSHGAMTGQMIEKIESILIKESPDVVLVYGDTNSTLAGALAACKLHVPVAHVEAGLRSFNQRMPEEVNRVLTDRISSLLFCPTETAIQNLRQEGIGHWGNKAKAIFSGDVMFDGALFYAEFARCPQTLAESEFALVTLHRAENTDNKDRFHSIIAALNEIGKNEEIVFPVHPRTVKLMRESNCDISNLTILEPVGYLEMLGLLQKSKFVMTDSGGLQKEAFFFRKPCYTLRDETEWIELVEHNFNVLVGSETEKIVRSWREHQFANEWDKPLYGKGQASKIVVEELLELMK